MIKILDSSKSLSVLASDTTNGIGVIQNISGTVTEELNGVYEASFTVALTEKYADQLSVGGLVLIKSQNGDQMFRIYKVSKPINQIITVYCQHISYDLTKVVVLPFTAVGSAQACSSLVSHITGGTYPFTMSTDIANASSEFTLDRPRTFRECLGGYSGSMLDVFRGEYEWDNLEVKMLANRGSDNGVSIAYGKNLTDFKQEENNQSVYTSVLGYANVNDVVYYGDVYHKVQSSQPKVKIVDFSSEYDMDDVPTNADLTIKAQTYATNNDIEVPNVNITVSFIELGQTNEYKDVAILERVSLGDTVHVYFSKLGVTATSKVIKTIWDINTQRYSSIELGNTKANLKTVLDETVQEAKDSATQTQSVVQSSLNDMVTLIINGLGLHRTLVKLADGGYRIYLHNKETLAQSDTQYVMSANGFLVSTDYGQTWNAGFDSSGNAVVNSLSTIVLRALEIYGSRITFGDENDKYITAGVYTQNGDAVGVSFDGSGYARFQPQEKFEVINKASNDAILNKIDISRSSTQTYIDLANSQYTNTIANFLRAANEILMQSDSAYNVTQIQNYRLVNFLTGGTIRLQSSEEQASVDMKAEQKLSSSSTTNGASVGVSSGLDYYGNVFNRMDLSVAEVGSGTNAVRIRMEQDGSIQVINKSMTFNGNSIVGNINGGSDAETSVASSSWITLKSFTLAAGTWLCDIDVFFASNATGRREALLSTSQNSSTPYYAKLANSMNAVNGTRSHVKLMHVFNITSQQTFYLNCYQNSGSALSTGWRPVFIPIPNY